MAKFNVVGLDDLQERMLQKAQIAEEAVPEMLKAGGAVMQEAQKAEIRKMFRRPYRLKPKRQNLPK